MLTLRAGSSVLAIALAVGCASGGSDTGDGTGGGGGVITGVGGSAMGGESGDGLPLGAPCSDDGECASNICEEVFFDLPDKVCVERCAGQEDCPADGFFCEAISPGAIDGYCIPRSPAHCAACDDNADCGHFTEVCIVGPNDVASACHVDCALAGADACPADYSCTSIDIGNTTRMLCVPSEPCADAQGGFCDNVVGPLACSRENAEGVCIGERTCDAASERFTACGADVPACKASCDAPDPAGCTLQSCGGISETVEHCGMCDNPCPGLGAPNAVPSCTDATCGFDCQGESYDVDGNVQNGCEKTDPNLGHHTQATGTGVGSFSCTDGSSNRNISGTIHSDMRGHVNPSIAGFDATTGAAPDWYNLFADGGLCENEVVLTLNVSGTGNLACYQLRVITNNGSHTCATNASGACTINQDGTGVYDDDTTIHIEVKKTCPASTPVSVTYTVTGHL